MFLTLRVVAFLLTMTYLFYLFYGTLRAVSITESFVITRRRTTAFLLFSLLLLLALVVSLIVTAYDSSGSELEMSSGAPFAVFWSTCNVYTLVLAFFFLPTKQEVHPDFGVRSSSSSVSSVATATATATAIAAAIARRDRRNADRDQGDYAGLYRHDREAIDDLDDLAVGIADDEDYDSPDGDVYLSRMDTADGRQQEDAIGSHPRR